MCFCFASHLAELALDACFVVAEWEQENKREIPDIQELDDVTQEICEQRNIVQATADQQVVGRPQGVQERVARPSSVLARQVLMSTAGVAVVEMTFVGLQFLFCFSSNPFICIVCLCLPADICRLHEYIIGE